jgi:hypothetical protein
MPSKRFVGHAKARQVLASRPFGEDFPAARRHKAAEPACPQPDLNRPPLRWQIRQRAPIPAMDTIRPEAAPQVVHFADFALSRATVRRHSPSHSKRPMARPQRAHQRQTTAHDSDSPPRHRPWSPRIAPHCHSPLCAHAPIATHTLAPVRTTTYSYNRTSIVRAESYSWSRPSDGDPSCLRN